MLRKISRSNLDVGYEAFLDCEQIPLRLLFYSPSLSILSWFKNAWAFDKDN